MPLAVAFPPALLVQCAIALGLSVVIGLLPPLPLTISNQQQLLHSGLEFLSVAVTLMIFTVGWFSFGHQHRARFQIIACTFLAVGILSFAHTLLYASQSTLAESALADMPHSADGFQLSARLSAGLGLLAAALLPETDLLTARTRHALLAGTLLGSGTIVAIGFANPQLIAAQVLGIAGQMPRYTSLAQLVLVPFIATLLVLICTWRREHDGFIATLLTGIWVLLIGQTIVLGGTLSSDWHYYAANLYKIWGSSLIFWAVYVRAMNEPYRRLRRSERELAVSQEQTRALLRENQILLDRAIVGIIHLKERRFMRVNRQAEILLGYERGELDGQSTEIMYPDYEAFLAIGKYAYSVVNRGEMFADEVEMIRKDGSRFWCLLRGHALTEDETNELGSGFIWIMEDVTQKREARQAQEVAQAVLRDSEQQFRAMFMASKVVMLLTDPASGEIVDANVVASAYYGYSIEQLRGMHVSQINTLSKQRVAEEMRIATAERRSHFYFQHRLASGEIRDVEVHAGPLALQNRQLLYSIVHDITDRRRLEIERGKLYQAVEQSPVSILITDLQGRIEYVNQCFTEVSGYERIEVLGQTPHFLRSEHTSIAVYEELWKTVSSGATLRGTMLNRRKNGEVHWEQVQVSPIYDASGRITNYLGINEDITARKALEDARRESEERLQRVLDGSNDGFWDWDLPSGTVLHSPRWAEILGYMLEEIESHIDASDLLVHPDDLPVRNAALQAHFHQETANYQCEYRMRAKDGTWRWILDRGKVTLRDDNGRPLQMAGTHTDITERCRMEEALRSSLATVKRHDEQMSALNRMNDLLLSCENCEQAYAIITHAAGRLFAGCYGGLAVVDEAHPGNMRVVSSWGDTPVLPYWFPQKHCWALRRGAVHEASATEQHVQCLHFVEAHPPTYFCVPLAVRGETYGMFHLSMDSVQSAGQLHEWRTLATTVSESIKLTILNLRLRETLREQAIRDPLTGLFNRRYLDESLLRELHRRQRHGEPLAAAMLDIDHFKRFNDDHGHEAGDAVLHAVGHLLKTSLRASDIACRYGGEELTIILPGANLNDARERLDKLRRDIMQLRVFYQGGELPTITVSIGVTAAAEHEIDTVALLARADVALYQAKAAGRNRVLVAH